MRVAVLGNSGSGKSTVARWLSAHSGAALLDLDTVAWEPKRIAVPRAHDDAMSDVRNFCTAHQHWVVEGCYAGLICAALESSPLLLFLNPGEAWCIANCQSRPWEPHKYASKAEQDERLAFLLNWTREYYSRDDDMSLSRHRKCFEAYAGKKVEVISPPKLEPPSPEVLKWLK
jgi:adenylate kinase family enzyme